MMIFDKELEKLKLRTQLRYMENFSRMFGPEEHAKVEHAIKTLREMQKIDPRAMTIAMTMVGCEGFEQLIENQEEIIKELAKKI